MMMNREVLMSAMKTSISDVLETMFFLPVEFDDSVATEESLDSVEQKIIAGKLNFDGPLSGSCIFYVPEKFAASLTADFLGKEKEDITSDQVKETVKEMTNMITGNTFSLYDPAAVYNLKVPELVGFDGFHKALRESEKRIFIKINSSGNYLAFQMDVGIND